MDAPVTRGFACADSDVLPPNPPVAPLSCFITTEAGIDSLAPSPELDHCAKSHACGPTRASSLSRFDRYGPRPASLDSLSDLDCAISQPTMPVQAGALDLRSAISDPSSPGMSSGCSLSDDPNGSLAGSAAPSPSRGPRRGPVAGMAGSTVPQLVMPSLTVPRRRSFSEVGKSIGRLRLMVAGRAGIGKTSLIQALGQNCQHIVHMDPFEPCAVGKVREIYASTRPDPWWRASPAPVAFKRRRQSLTDDVLDRNLCFLDCPALPDYTEAGQYVHTQLLRLCDRPIEDEDLFNLLSSGAGSIVHAVLYMVPSTGPDSADIRCIQSLQELTNVIPLLARADELPSEALTLSKDRFVNMLSDQGLDWFSFTEAGSALNTSSVYAVSSAIQQLDCHTTDASIHMSFEILRSHVPTDLEELIGRIFSLDGSSWLRYSAALKSVSWRRRQLLESTSQFALTSRSLTTYGALVPHTGTNLYFERRQWGQIELLSWAESLQQSLRAERCHRWPPAVGANRGLDMRVAKADRYTDLDREQIDAEPANANHQDPLGLLELGSRIKHGGRLALELMSSLGVFGCISVWLIRPEMARHWGTGSAPSWCLVRL